MGLQSNKNWSKIVRLGNFQLYKQEFNEVQKYFSEKIPEALALGNAMINHILQNTH